MRVRINWEKYGKMSNTTFQTKEPTELEAMTKRAEDAESQVKTLKQLVLNANSVYDEVILAKRNLADKLDFVNKDRDMFRNYWYQVRDVNVFQARAWAKDLRGMGKGLATKDRKIKELRAEITRLTACLEATRHDYIDQVVATSK